MDNEQSQTAGTSVDQRALAINIYTNYIRAKTCHVLGAIFGIVGFIVFAVMFQRFVVPDVVNALRRISTLGLVFFPFVPTLFFTWLGRRYEKRYLALSQKQ